MPSYKTDLIRVPKSKQFNNIRVNIIIQELIKQLLIIPGQQIFRIGLLPGKVLVNTIDPFNVCTNIISDSLDHVGI